MSKAAFSGLFIFVLIGALFLRITLLTNRPMHHDEANQAVKFGNLLESGEYRYDKSDHHGPSLYYLSLPLAWLFSKTTLAALDEKVIRLLPALFGTATLLLFLLIRSGMKKEAVLSASLLMALSPAAVYYSRFYIQETLLVFFLVGFLIASWRYIQRPSWIWALVAGFFSGLMYTTKETCVIAFGAVFGGWLLYLITLKKKKKTIPSVSLFRHIGYAVSALAVFFLVSWLFYSSFFRNPGGWMDSVRSFGSYFVKAGQPEWHAHPWFYYLKILFFSKYGSGPAWSEALILGLALIGCVAAFRKIQGQEVRFPFLKYIFVYTAIATVVYSLIPYKTPWNLLPFYVGIILLAGGGVSYLLNKVRYPYLRFGTLLILCLGFFHLGLQSYRANFVFQADPRNPYVYAQTSPDFLGLIQRVEDVAPEHPEGNNMLIKVIANPYDTWPLPWYLRQFGRVGYWREVRDAGNFESVPLIISSLDKLDQLKPHIRDQYQSEFYGLRPEVLLAVHIRRDLWDRLLEKRN
ncbi:MAG: TIGR03663 family protein [Candidatus Aminicenantes bacterium]|jgi:uncharacterized protein (TIGR03663 family)